MIQAQWHDVVFEQSAERLRAIQSISTGVEIEAEQNNDTEGQPATNTIRRKLQTISLKYRALTGTGIDPRADFAGWDYCIRNGFHAPFYLAGESFEGREFLCKKVSIDSETVDSNGHILYADFSVEFEEYAEEASGLKSDKGPEINLQPGIAEYQQQERNDYLRASATEQDRIRLAQIGAA